MPRKKKVVQVPLSTIWELPDAAWAQLEPLLAKQYPPAKTGRPRANLRQICNGIIFRLRSSCQWNQLPKIFGDDSTVHRWFQRWVKDGIFETLWATLLSDCEELHGVDWQWQSADGCMGKARMGGKKQAAIPPTVENRGPKPAWLLKPAEARLA